MPAPWGLIQKFRSCAGPAACYRKATPTLSSVRPTTRQGRLVWLSPWIIRRSKIGGIPTGLATSRHAPSLDMLRTTQSIAAPWPNVIFADFKARVRASDLRSSMFAAPKRSRHRRIGFQRPIPRVPNDRIKKLPALGRSSLYSSGLRRYPHRAGVILAS